MNPDLQNYIISARRQGLTDDQIRQNLAAQGWDTKQITEALAKSQINQSNTNPAHLIFVISTTLVIIFLAPSILMSIVGFVFCDRPPCDFTPSVILFFAPFFFLAQLMVARKLNQMNWRKISIVLSLIPIIFIIYVCLQFTGLIPFNF